MNKKDLFIKQRFKQDKEISDKANKIFENIKEEFELENEKKGFKVGWKGLIATVVSVAIVTTVGISLVQKSQGKPNLISKIEALVKKEDDLKLNKHVDSEIGVSFDYPEEWVGLDNNRGSNAVGVWLMPAINEKYVENVHFWVSKLQENTDLSPRKIAQNNNSFIGVMREGDKEIAGNKGYYVETKREYTENLLNYEVKAIDIYVVTNYGVYNISYSGDVNLYDKYYKTFEKMLETIKFSKPIMDGSKNNDNNDVELTNYIYSEIGVRFYYPEDWKYTDNNHGSGAVSVGLNKPDYNNVNQENAFLNVEIVENSENLTLEQYYKKELARYEEDNVKKENGNIEIAGKSGYYIIINGEVVNKFIFLNVDSTIYQITCLPYDKYSKTFDAILETIKFSKPIMDGSTNIGNNNLELTNYIYSEIGVRFYYPEDWKYTDNNHGSGAVSVGLNKPDYNNVNQENAFLNVEIVENSENLTLEQYYKKELARYEEDNVKKENGNIEIAGKSGYYIIINGEVVDKFIFLNVGSTIYQITCLPYDKYSKTFDAILETVIFSSPLI